MTREEAIGYLLGEYVVVHEGNEEEKELNQAIDMAITALSAEPSGDLISRADAIEAVENNSYGMGSRASVKAIKALPSADAISREDTVTLNSPISIQAVQGEWKLTEINGYQYAVCDQCHLLADMVEKDGKLVMSMAVADDEYANFCPNCGARMKGGVE